MPVTELAKLLQAAPGVIMHGSEDEFATAVTHAAGKDEVFVSRLRRDHTHPRGINLWVVSDNVRKGAALNAVQIMETICQKEQVGDNRIHGKETHIA